MNSTLLASMQVSFDILKANLTSKKLERQASLKAIIFFITYQRRRCLKKLREYANANSSQRFKQSLATTFSKLCLQKIGLHRWKQYKQLTIQNSPFTQIINIFPSEKSLLVRHYFTRFFQLLQQKIRKQNAKHMYFRKNKLIASQAFEILRNNRLIKQKWKLCCENIDYDYVQQTRVRKVFSK